MLDLKTPNDLARLLEVKPAFMWDVLRNADRYLRAIEIRSSPTKVRRVVSANPPLYNLQRRFFNVALVPNFDSTVYSHGGIRGRSIKSNALAHAGQQFVYTTDISNFFPSIRRERVKAWFERVGCSQQVSWLCARLCTADNCLQQGLLTSPFIADQLMKQADSQIASACAKLEWPLVYTRYVDDISISGLFDLKQSRIPQLIRRILQMNGFRAKVEKEQFGSLESGTSITKVRVRNGRLDVEKEYAIELTRALGDHAALGEDGQFTGPFYTPDQLWGKVAFVAWVNPGRSKELTRLYNSIQWASCFKHASDRGLLTLFRN